MATVLPSRSEALRDSGLDGDQQVLVSTLKPGNIVVVDKLAADKPTAVRKSIEAAGVEILFLSPRGPDFNPIETAFAKLKAVLKKVAARIVQAPWCAPSPKPSASSPSQSADLIRRQGLRPRLIGQCSSLHRSARETVLALAQAASGGIWDWS